MLKLAGIDLDDTLVATVKFFSRARDEMSALMAAQGLDAEALAQFRADLGEIELKNVQPDGFGMSVVYESYVEAAAKHAPVFDKKLVADIGAVVDRLRSEPRPPFDDAKALLERLAELGVPVVIITAGEYNHQNGKLDALKAVLGPAWAPVQEFIVQRKTEDEYRAILDAYGVKPEEFVMIGDSMKSDIVPVRQLGGQAILIERPAAPSALRWSFHHASYDGGYDRVENLNQACDFIAARLLAEGGMPPPAAPQNPGLSPDI